MRFRSHYHAALALDTRRRAVTGRGILILSFLGCFVFPTTEQALMWLHQRLDVRG